MRPHGHRVFPPFPQPIFPSPVFEKLKCTAPTRDCRGSGTQHGQRPTWTSIYPSNWPRSPVGSATVLQPSTRMVPSIKRVTPPDSNPCYPLVRNSWHGCSIACSPRGFQPSAAGKHLHLHPLRRRRVARFNSQRTPAIALRPQAFAPLAARQHYRLRPSHNGTPPSLVRTADSCATRVTTD